MKAIATFDIGTTAVKGVLMETDGRPLCIESRGLETLYRGADGNLIEQNPRQWYDAVCQISARFGECCEPKEIAGVILSGQMQDLILLDEAGEPVADAILYSDGRAAAEAEEIAAIIGRDELERITANAFDGSRPLAKQLWVRRHAPDIYRRTVHALVSAKDFIIAKLARVYVTDVTSASTAGLMDIESKRWQGDWLARLELTGVSWARLCPAHERVGVVCDTAAKETGFMPGTPVYAGSGDAGATTLAGGVAQEGELSVNLGTSGWVARAANQPLYAKGVSNLAAIPPNAYINVVPFFNAGNVHGWAAGLLCGDDTADARYKRFEALAAAAAVGSGGLLFLPYLVGERFPVMDAAAAGCFADVRASTGRAEFARAALEGVGYSIRQGLEAMGGKPASCSLVGGGSRSAVWCQILADMLRLPVRVYRDATHMPSMALAAAVPQREGEPPDYSAFADKIRNADTCVNYLPNKLSAAVYDRYYKRFISLYPMMRQLEKA